MSFTTEHHVAIPQHTSSHKHSQELQRVCTRGKMKILGASLGMHPIDPHNKEGTQIKSEAIKLLVCKTKVLNRLRRLNASFPADVLFGKA